MPTPFRDAQQAVGFVQPQFYNIEQTIYQVRYPSFDYASIIPVVTEGNEWAQGALFYSGDIAGKAEFISGQGFDMPYADVSRTMFTKGFELAGAGYEWNLTEVNQAIMGGRNIGDEKARAARSVAEAFLWNIAMTGKQDGVTSEKGWTGLVNDASVPTANVAADGTGSSRLWSAKTPALILRDINAGLEGIVTVTNETELADTLLLPTSLRDYIAYTPRSDNSDRTILSYLQENNVYTATTGQPLTIRALRALNTAGSGSTTRMVAFRKSPEVVRFHLPMPHRFLPPFQKSSMTWEVAGIMRTGGTEIRLPKAMSYLDGM